MDALFSCRNCVHNCAQSLNLGRGVGYCLHHNSLIQDPDDTTCKYLHRQDLPRFVVEEGIEEHAVEFLQFPAMATLSTKQPLRKQWYSERVVWERGKFDPLVLLSARYHRASHAWVMIETLSGRVDGRVSMAHAALIRRYMHQCGTWTSSYRLILSLLRELDAKPQFDKADLVIRDGDAEQVVADDALWDVVFSRLAAVQEYGWHSGLEELLWATDRLNGALTEFSWEKLEPELAAKRGEWTGQVIEHAKEQGEFFPPPEVEAPEEGR